jgi:hypothetical protein
MAWVTRNGTRVLHPAASALAILAETYHDASEYRVYGRILVGDSDSPRFAAEDGDTLLVHHCDEPRLPDMAHVLNLVNGMNALIPWNALAHTAKPWSA